MIVQKNICSARLFEIFQSCFLLLFRVSVIFSFSRKRQQIPFNRAHQMYRAVYVQIKTVALQRGRGCCGRRQLFRTVSLCSSLHVNKTYQHQLLAVIVHTRQQIKQQLTHNLIPVASIHYSSEPFADLHHAGALQNSGVSVRPKRVRDRPLDKWTYKGHLYTTGHLPKRGV